MLRTCRSINWSYHSDRQGSGIVLICGDHRGVLRAIRQLGEGYTVCNKGESMGLCGLGLGFGNLMGIVGSTWTNVD